MNAPEAVAPTDAERRFSGIRQLYGAAGLARLQAAHVTVVGIGGVGSWAAEALARSAVGAITLVDLDHISESNTNRQIHALGGAYGRAKVEAMAERIVQINPACRVHCVDAFVDGDNVGALVAGAQWVIDCIDQVAAKAALVAQCRAQGTPVVVCGAGGGRLDPTRLCTGDLARAHGDPLLSKLRYRLRRHHGFPRETARRVPRFGVLAVYSDEPVAASHVGVDGSAAGSPLACSGYGSSVALTGALGFAAAALVMRSIAWPDPANRVSPMRGIEPVDD